MYVIPEMMTSAATDLATIGWDLGMAHGAAAVSTVALIPAAADEISVGIAHLFSEHAHGFHELAGKTSAFHGQFVENLKASAASYASADSPIGSTAPAATPALYGLGPVYRFIDFLRNPPDLTPLQLVGVFVAGLVPAGLFFGLIAVGIVGLLVALPIIAIRTLQAGLGLPLPPWPIP
jgi:hypothetical protein